MPNKIDIELVHMSQDSSECTVWNEPAIVFTNKECERRGIPWRAISKEVFSMDNALTVAIIEGYDRLNPAVYCGISGNDAVYTIYKQQEE